MTFDTNQYPGLTEEPAEESIKRVHLSGQEWIDLKRTIRKLKQGWVRHANAARNLRPARSRSGYSLVSIKPGGGALVIEFETPYPIDAYRYNQVKTLLVTDLPKFCEEMGYTAVFFGDSKSKATCLAKVRIVGSRAHEFYRIIGVSEKIPDMPFFEEVEAEDEE